MIQEEFGPVGKVIRVLQAGDEQAWRAWLDLLGPRVKMAVLDMIGPADTVKVDDAASHLFYLLVWSLREISGREYGKPAAPFMDWEVLTRAIVPKVEERLNANPLEYPTRQVLESRAADIMLTVITEMNAYLKSVASN